MKKEFILFFMVVNLFAQNEGNVQNELSVQNTQIFYFNHQRITSIDDGKDFFKPYLSFLKENGSYEGKLMDSFVLYDNYFFNNFYAHPIYGNPKTYNGRLNSQDLDNYLDNLFIKTKVPIIKEISNNRVGFIGNNESSSLIYPFEVTGNQELELSFEIIAPDLQEPTGWDGIIVGVKYFNSENQEILIQHDVYNFAFQAFSSVQNIWEQKEFNILVPDDPDIISAKLFLMNYKLHIDSHLYVDNVYLKNNNLPINYINENDSKFDVLPKNSTWEFIKNYKKNKQFLFNNRTSLFSEINDANNELPNPSIIKLIPILPSIDKDYFNQNGFTIIELKNKISDYINNIEQRFNSWKINNPYSKLEIEGLYFVDEHIKDGKEAFLNPILEYTRDLLHSKGWRLYGSPYIQRIKNDCSISSSFHLNTINIFDVIYQQPNSFFYLYKDQDPNQYGRDRELLKMTNDLMKVHNINVNIENRVILDSIGEEYGRINDYFDYGDKYGYINYSKLFYDDAGAHYLNAHSNKDKERIDYENLYKFIRKSKKGEIINGNFEISNDINPSFLYNWNGNYMIKNNIHSFSIANREIEVLLNNDLEEFHSEDIIIKENKKYNLTFKAKELSNSGISNNALIGVIFYDNDDNELQNLNLSMTNLKFSDYLNHHYLYLDISQNYQHFKIYFQAPLNAVKFKFYLKRTSPLEIKWKSFNFFEEGKIQKSKLLYSDNSFQLKLDKDLDYGKHSVKLYNSDFIESAEKISVVSNKLYSLSFDIREKLPIAVFNQQNKALIAIETFNHSGTKITPSLSNLSYSSIINSYYKYVSSIDQEWKTFLLQTNFPTDVASIKISIHNWNYHNSIIIDNVKIAFVDINTPISLSRKTDKDNIIEIDKWSEKTPLRSSYLKPVYYNGYIDVCKIAKLEFSGLFRNSDGSNNKNLLAFEFFDSNFSLLTQEDISDTNLYWSDSYKFWWRGEYYQINSNRCDYTEDWTRNQWKEIMQSVKIPSKAKYIRFSFHKLSDNEEEFLILNPQVRIKTSRPCIQPKNYPEAIFDTDEVILYPNPTEKDFTVLIEEKSNFEIYDIQGKLLKSGNTDENPINISHFSNGVYFMTIKMENEIKQLKIIKI